MKIVVGFVLSLTFLPGVIMGTDLSPADHATCQAALYPGSGSLCEEGLNFYINQSGQCGCLSKEEINQLAPCSADLVCPEFEEPSTMFEIRNIGGVIAFFDAGCGCFMVPQESNTEHANVTVSDAKDNVIPLPTEQVQSTVACSTSDLVTAINNANMAVSTTLTLAANCTYSFSSPAVPDNALPPITSNITIIGQEKTVIERAFFAAINFRFFTVNSGATLTLKHMKLENGNVMGNGGAILNNGILNLEQMIITSNNADNGAGFSNEYGAVANIIKSQFLANRTKMVGGGAIINFGTAIISHSGFHRNSAPLNGGAINTQAGGVTTITSSDFSGNFASNLGGALSNSGISSITDSQIYRNTADSGGGIATSTSSVLLQTSTVFSNAKDNCFPINSVSGCSH